MNLTAPFVMVIFGATGDLTQRKLLPALFHLFKKKKLSEQFYIVGFSRRTYSQDEFREFLHEALKKYDKKHELDEKIWREFCSRIHYQQGEFEVKGGYEALISKLKEFDTHLNACVPRFFYLATPPDKYASILTFLHETKLSEGCGQGSDKWTKVMIEKPFGRDMEDARELDKLLAKTFREEQIYRIDHYLGKETVQNIVAFRYSNALFDPVWNRQFIDHVQITIAETLGVETRGNFFEGVGTLRDMAQSHLLELMAAIAMKPKAYTSVGLREARAQIIASIKMIAPSDVAANVVRGQYGPRDGLKAYREEKNVSPDSNTETFVALKLTLKDPRWEGVPFYMRTGKRLARKATEISVVLKKPRHELFGKVVIPAKAGIRSERETDLHFREDDNKNMNESTKLAPDILTFRIDPNEGIELRLNAKQTGFQNDFNVIPLSFSYHKDTELPEAYERLLLDGMKGDQTLFTRTDEVASSWEFIGNIIKSWSEEKPKFPSYTPGTWGPKEATDLIQKDGRSWLLR